MRIRTVRQRWQALVLTLVLALNASIVAAVHSEETLSASPASVAFAPDGDEDDNASFHTAASSELLSPFPEEEPHRFPDTATKAAIVLNLNARSVTPRVAELAKRVFGSQHVFVTETEEQARQAAKTIVQHSDRYSLVVPVGGDGTLSSIINYLTEEILSQSSSPAHDVNWAVRQLPTFGYIPLGTGNGAGSVVGCFVRRRNPIRRFLTKILPRSQRRKLRNLEATMKYLKQAGEAQLYEPRPYLPFQSSSNKMDPIARVEVVELPMMQVLLEQDNKRGDLCFFAGVGFDSLMLNDFKATKAWSHETGILKSVLSSVTGYVVAMFFKTLPQCLRGAHIINVCLTTQDPSHTLWIDHRRGDLVQRIPDNRNTTIAPSKVVLYEGRAGILCAGTSPFYGGGVRLFPFARLTENKMHLRLGRINPLLGALSIPSIMEGSYREKSHNFGCLDFLGTDFEVQVSSQRSSKGYPFQHSGESVGHVKQFRLRVVPEPIRFVSFAIAPVATTKSQKQRANPNRRHGTRR